MQTKKFQFSLLLLGAALFAAHALNEEGVGGVLQPELSSNPSSSSEWGYIRIHVERPKRTGLFRFSEKRTHKKHSSSVLCGEKDNLKKLTKEELGKLFVKSKEMTPWNKDMEVYNVPKFTEEIELVAKASKVAGTEITLEAAFNAMAGIGCHPYIHGGVVRDFLVDEEVKDFDMGVSCKSTEVQTKLCTAGQIFKDLEGAHCVTSPIKGKFTLVKIGKKGEGDLDPLDVMDYEAEFGEPLEAMENTANILSYDWKNKVIFDPTGRGYKDCCNKHLVIVPPKEKDWPKWLEIKNDQSENPKKILRYFKMHYKGFTVPEEFKNQDKFVVDSIKKYKSQFTEFWLHKGDAPSKKDEKKAWKPYGSFPMEGSDSFNQAHYLAFYCKDFLQGKPVSLMGHIRCRVNCGDKETAAPKVNDRAKKKGDGVLDKIVEAMDKHGAKELATEFKTAKDKWYCQWPNSCPSEGVTTKPPGCLSEKDMKDPPLVPPNRPDYWRDLFSWDKKTCGGEKTHCAHLTCKPGGTPTKNFGDSVYKWVSLNKVRWTQATISGETTDGTKIDKVIDRMRPQEKDYTPPEACGEKGLINFKLPNVVMGDEFIQSAEMVEFRADHFTSIDNRRIYAAVSAAWDECVKKDSCKGALKDHKSDWFKSLPDKYKILARVHHPDEELPYSQKGRFGKKMSYKKGQRPDPKKNPDEYAQTWGQAASFRCAQQKSIAKQLKGWGEQEWDSVELGQGSRRPPYIKP